MCHALAGSCFIPQLDATCNRMSTSCTRLDKRPKATQPAAEAAVDCRSCLNACACQRQSYDKLHPNTLLLAMSVTADCYQVLHVTVCSISCIVDTAAACYLCSSSLLSATAASASAASAISFRLLQLAGSVTALCYQLLHYLCLPEAGFLRALQLAVC